MKPIIGIPLRYNRLKDDRPIVYLSERCRRTIVKAGGFVYPISPVQDIDYINVRGVDFPSLTEQEKEDIKLSLSILDGILFPGGIKFNEYDRFLLDIAIKEHIPILGICLGMQLLSCHNSGIDLNDINTSINHKQTNDNELTHFVNLDKNSKLFKIIGEERFMVNSFHLRQASNNGDYKTIGYSDDKVIEAIEYPGEDFNIGVQWHPEISYDFDLNSRKIIDSFILAARNYHINKQK